jgi:hypothetical protein
MHCLVTAGKHVNNIRALARQPPITTIELLGAVFSVGSAPRLYNEEPRPTEGTERVRCSVESRAVKRRQGIGVKWPRAWELVESCGTEGVEGWQFS